MPVPVDDVFRRREGNESHGPPGVELLGADADLRPEAELKAVGEAGRRIDIDRRRIHLV